MLLLPTLLLYALGLLLTGIGSRLASRCATWCGALCGLPMWMVGGTLVAVCTALPQLVLAFLAAGMSVTALAVGTALAGAVTQLGLVLALCLLRCNVTVDRGELLRKCALLLVACGVVALFVRDGTLSYTGTGLLMGLFVLFVMQSIAYQYRFAFREGLELITVQKEKGEKTPPEDPSGRTVLFPAMSIRTSLRNLAGVVGGMAVLCVGAWALLNSAVALANLTGTIQAQWAATLISFGLCLPLLVEVFDHPLGSAWKRFAEKCRIYPPQALPMQVLNSAILSITLVLPAGITEGVHTAAAQFAAQVQAEYGTADPAICLQLTEQGCGAFSALDADSTQRLRKALLLMPWGVQAMSMDVPGLVETSLNLGVAELDDSEAILRFSIRSSVPSAKELLSCKLQTLTELLGGSVRFHGDYPAWTYARESALRDRCVAVYEAQYGAKPQIVAIHAGLECGILSGKIEGLDCISFGPNLLHVHTPNERADIASVARVWEYLKAILAYKE